MSHLLFRRTRREAILHKGGWRVRPQLIRRGQPRLEGLEQRLVLSTGSAKAMVESLPTGDAQRVSTNLLVAYERAVGLAMPSSLQTADASSLLLAFVVRNRFRSRLRFHCES